jgi:hypothetical protein
MNGYSFDTHRSSDTYLMGRRAKVNHWCADEPDHALEALGRIRSGESK